MTVTNIIDRKTGSRISTEENSFNLNGSKIVMIEASRGDIQSMDRQGNQLIIKMKSGEVITINDFFVMHADNESELVLNDQTAEGGGYWWIEEPATGTDWSQINNLDPLMIQGDQTGGIAPWMYWAAAGVGLAGAGIAAASSGGGGGHDSVPAPNIPSDPIVLTNNENGITGTADPGTVVILTRPDGTTEVAVVDKDGNWSFTNGGNPLNDGEEGKFVSENGSGNSSNEVSSIADTKAPDKPVIEQNNGDELGGTAEPGSEITLEKPDGSTVTTITDKDGNWSFEPNPLEDGAEGKVTAKDEAGNTSDPENTGIADTEAPNAPLIDTNNGSELTGTAEAGSTITLKDEDGNVLGTTETDSSGNWVFNPNLLGDGESGEVTATDKAGNTSSETDTGITDATAPNVPLVDTNNGTKVSGTAEPGSTITVKDDQGNIIATTDADPSGNWSIQPNPLQNDQEGHFTATDSAGNESGETLDVADTQAPNGPQVISNNVSGIKGTAEPGSTITLTDDNGTIIGTTETDTTGKWSFNPNPLQDGQQGHFTATDEAGNESNETLSTANTSGPTDPVVEINNGTELSGTSDPGTTITLKDEDGNVLGTTETDPSGNWSFNPNLLGDGESGEVTATDDSGNNSNDIDTGITDAVAPNAPLIDTNNGSELTGTAEAGSTITLKDEDGNVLGTTETDSSGNWVFNPNLLGDGESGEVTATDKAGNTSPETDTGITDAVAPNAPLVDTNNGSELAGTAEAGSTITLKDEDGNVLGTTETDSSGNWVFNPNLLGDGESGEVTATDKAGNTSPETDTGITDAVAPNAPLVDTNNGSELAGTAEAGSTITLKDEDGNVLGTTETDSSGNWVFNPNLLGDGESGEVTATDKAGNTSPETDTGITDAVAPNAPLIDTNNGSELAGTAEAGSTITLKDEDGNVLGTTETDSSGNWVFNPNLLGDGESGEVTATDKAGNTSPETDTIITDATAPNAPLVDTNNGSELTGTAEAGSTITLKDEDGNVLGTTETDPSGNWVFNPNLLGDGESGEVTATDKAGNTSSETDTGITDATAPNAPLVDTNNGTKVSGTAEPGSTITVKDDQGNIIATTDADPSGNWSIQPNPLQNDQEGHFTATDSAGNESGETLDVADTQAPNGPQVISNNVSGIKGTAESGSTITLTDDNGTIIGTTETDTTGKWSFNPNPLQDGQQGHFTATDEAGNESNETLSTANTSGPTDPVVEINNGTELSGTSDPGTTITLKDEDGNVLGTTETDPSGNWSFNPNLLGDGESGEVTATDDSGNNSNDIDTGITDAVAPNAPLIDTNNGSELAGTAEPGSTITLKDEDGNVLGTTETDPSGNWVFNPNLLGDGESGEVTATDKAGNTSPETDTVITDATAPNAPLVDTNNGSELTGTAEAGSTITLKDEDGNVLGTTETDPSGNWVFNPNLLGDGESGEVTATDKAGNTSPETDTGITDAVAPNAPLIDTNNGSELAGTAEAGSTITLKDEDGNVLGTTETDPSGNWVFNPNLLGDGESGEVTATDKAGNTSPETDTGITDAVAPNAPLVDTNNGSELTGTAEAGSTITLKDEDGNVLGTTETDPSGNWVFNPNLLGDGESGEVTATDKAGNTSPETDTGITDAVAPNAPLVDTNNGSELTGTAEAGSTITLKDEDGNVLGTTETDPSGNWVFNPNLLGDGESGEVTATDRAGNTSSETDTGITDAVAPNAPLVDTNNGSELAGTAEAGSTITLKDEDGNVLGTTETDPSGNWVFNPNLLGDGESGEVTATDKAGNTSPETDTGITDAVAPNAPLIDTNNGSELAGTAEAGSTITLKDEDGNVLGTTETDPSGNWVFNPNLLGDGESGEVTATDKAGNTSPETDTVITDATAPNAPLVDTNNGSELTGTAEAGSTITLKDEDGNVLGTTETDPSGNWVFNPNLLGDGESGEVTATDRAGNTSSETDTGITDAVAPNAPLVDTNNGSELAGTAEAGSTITLKDEDGNVLGTTETDPSGNWVFNPNLLGDGESGKVTATDKAGNTSPETDTGITDAVAPNAPLVDTNNGSELAGTAEAGSTITLKDEDGNVLGTTETDSSGNWVFNPNLLGDGESGEVTATDKAGNTSSETDTVITDAVAPNAPLVDTNNGSELTGTAEAGSTITLKDEDGNVLGTTETDPSGNWVFNPNLLGDGESGEVTATDKAGNTSPETDTGITDAVAPNAPLVDTNNGSELAGTAEAGSTITLKDEDGNVLGTTETDPSGNWVFNPNLLGDGESGEVTATDKAGNTSPETDTGITDAVAPNAPLVDTNNGTKVSGTAESGSTITVKDDQGNIIATTDADPSGNWSIQPNPLQNDQEGHFTATDSAGNESGETLDVADTQAPGAPHVTNNNASGVTGTAEENSTIILERSDGSTVTTKADGDGNWSFAPNPLGNDELGKFTATDEAGNKGDESTSRADTLPPDAPTITNVVDDQDPVTGNVADQGYTNDKTPTINGTAEGGVTITIYNGDEILGTTVANPDGSWSFTPTTELPDGTYNFTAVAKDPAGNSGDESNSHSVIIDTEMPVDNTITIDSISDDTGILGTDFITNDPTLIFKGTLANELQANEQVVISLDGGSTWHVVDVNGTDWSYDNTANNMEGFYDIEVRVTTKSGNYNGTNAEQLIDVDITAPSEAGLDTTFTISTDTSHGLTSGNEYSQSETATNSDLVTRDQTITVAGELTRGLNAGSYLQLWNGTDWVTLTVGSDNKWSYTAAEFGQSTTVDYQLRVVDAAGNAAADTNFKDKYEVVVDLDSPDGISKAPEVPADANENTAITYDSSTYGKVEAGAIVSIVRDVNKDGSYQEGVDKVLAFTRADDQGNWSFDVSLPSGSHQLGFVVWDEAGNHSGLSSVTNAGVSEGDGSGFEVIQQSWGGTSTGYLGINTAAVTLQNGQWSFFQSANSGTNNGVLYNMKDTVNNPQATFESVNLDRPSGVTDTGYGGYISSVSFMDINRDGFLDLVSMKSGYGGGNTSVWMQNADGSYTAVNQALGDLVHFGGAVVFDRTGDGYADVIFGDSEQDSLLYLDNTNGALTYYNLKNDLPGNAGNAGTGGLSLMHEISGVDLNNDGTIDIAGHSNANAAGNGYGNYYGRSLTIIYNNDGKLDEVVNLDGIFKNNSYVDEGDQIMSMTWADFNGDGFMDLFIGSGAKGGSNTNESRIYLNDGQGNLLATDSDALWFGDSTDAGTTLAVDWNHDGKMDIIEIPRYRVTGSPTLYTNTGDNVWNSADQSQQIGPSGQYSGAVSVDYDWDGAADLILYKAGNPNSDASHAILIKNTNAVADGTSLHIKIVDGEGVNSFYGNTINLYDSNGNLVATQIINPQSSGSNNSTGLVSFYGLDPNETYSVQMLRIKDGVASHVGDGNNYGNYTEGTINSAWGGLLTGKAHDAYVLTAESNGESHTTLGDGITGTGYNDTFVAMAGDRTYNGGGGWNYNPNGDETWSSDGGLDVIDYSSVTSGMTIDLAAGTATSADGTYNHKLVSIEGVIGTNQADTITTSGTANTIVEGGAGNDTFKLTAGAHDTLMYRLLEGATADGTGGNGHDTIEGFHVGDVKSDSDADIINLGDLLDYKGPIAFYMDEGVKKLDYNSKAILDYIKAEVNENGDTVISIDRDGQGSGHDFTELVTLKGTDTDLLTLLTNNQIVV